MEVKINREIRNYTESMFFGLSMRQFIFSVLACGVAVYQKFLTWKSISSFLPENKPENYLTSMQVKSSFLRFTGTAHLTALVKILCICGL